MKRFTRREALRRGVVPLVAVTGSGGLAAAVRGAAKEGSPGEVAFATVTDASDTALTVRQDEASSMILPIERVKGKAAGPWHGNPFRAGDRVVLDLDTGQAVVGVEPLSDALSGTVDRHQQNRLSVGGTTFLVDKWSLARIGAAAGGSGRVVPLSDVTLAAGTQVAVLARRSRGAGALRVTAVFAGDRTDNLYPVAATGAAG